MNKSEIIKKLIMLLSTLSCLAGYFYLRRFLIPWLKQLDKDYSGLEINLIAGLIMLLVPALALTFYYVYYIFIDSFWRPVKTISLSIENVCSLLLKAEPKWGLSINSNQVKYANTAEALFFLKFFPDYVTPISMPVFKEGINTLINSITQFGIQSNSYQKHTVQCSSLGLYALAGLSDGSLIEHDQLQKIKILHDSLLNPVSAYGWGTLNEPLTKQSDLRYTTSFWALRAINAYSKSELPVKARSAIISLIQKQSDGKFGFQPGDQPKLTSICLFLLLVHELKDSSLKESIVKSIPINNLLQFPKQVLNSLFAVEVEDYSTSQFINMNVERLPYTHVAPIYAVTVLICYKNRLSLIERVRLRILVHKIMHDFNKNISAGIGIPGLQQQYDNPFIFPIAYFLEMINYYRKEYNL